MRRGQALAFECQTNLGYGPTLSLIVGCSGTILDEKKGEADAGTPAVVWPEHPLLKQAERRGSGRRSKHRSARFDQWRNQLLINKELLISQCHLIQKVVCPP